MHRLRNLESCLQAKSFTRSLSGISFLSHFYRNRNGEIIVSVIDFGAAIQSVRMKDKQSHMEVGIDVFL